MNKNTIIFFLAGILGLAGSLQAQQRILFVVSNADTYGNSSIKTANHFGEIVLAYHEFLKAGYHIDFVSPEGGSVALGYLNSDTLLQRYLHDHTFMNALNQTRHPDQVYAQDYRAVYFPGGGAAMFGVHDSKAIQQITADIYESGSGVVSAVCHGSAGIANVKLSNGRFLVAGKRVNGFPDLFEHKDAAYFKEFPFSIQDQITANGGEFRFSKTGWDGYLEIDDQLITGQDPSSAAAVAQAVISRLKANDERVVAIDVIDQLFDRFNRKDHPAVAMAALYQGEVVYMKAFGSEQLDPMAPATIDTKFQLAGLSKHFTAFAMLLLEEKGHISLEDDIRKYLPELPEYPEIITIDHLMSMTSGLPDFWTLKRIAGWREGDVFTQTHALDLIRRSEPAFAPGEDYIYSNTDLLLMAEIIASVSDQSFANFLKDQLFDPLGMSNTIVKEDHEQFIPQVAHSYEASTEGFRTSPVNYGIAGPTNIYSTVADLAKWELNLMNPTIGSQALVEKLYTPSTLNSGQTMNPLFGQLTYGQQLYHRERGIMEAYQTGSLGGYASAIFKFMDHNLTTIVLSSGIPYSGFLGMQTANLYLTEQFTEPEEIDYQSLPFLELSTEQLVKHTGRYWNHQAGYLRTITLVKDTLRYVRGDGRSSALLPLSENTFQMYVPGDEHITVTFRDNHQSREMAFVFGESDPIVSTLIPAYDVSADELATYTGTYYCPTLQISYELQLSGTTLIAQNNKAGSITLSPVSEGLFEGDQWFFSGIRFDANKQSFTINTEEVRGLRFEKIQSANGSL